MSQAQNIEKQIALLSNLRLGFGIAALLLLALAVFLFFYLHIPDVFNEYRGKSAQKEMEAMAADSNGSGRIARTGKTKKKKSSSDHVQRRHYTDNLTDELGEQTEVTGQMKAQPQTAYEAKPAEQAGEEATDVLQQTMGEEATDILQQTAATELLDASVEEGTEATGILTEGTGVLLHEEDPDQQYDFPGQEDSEEATDILTEKMLQEDGMAATDILNPSSVPKTEQPREHDGTMVLAPEMLKPTQGIFEVERSILLIHTEKVI